MIPAGVVQCSRLSVSIRTDAGNLLCQMLNGFDQAAVATQAEQHTMKTDVAVEHRQKVAGINRLAVLTLYRLEAGDVRLRHRKRQDAHRHDLKQLAYVVNLRHLPGCEIAHDRATVRDALDDSLLFQIKQSKPDVSAMGIEVRAQVLLDEALARVPLAEHDALLKLPRDQ